MQNLKILIPFLAMLFSIALATAASPPEAVNVYKTDGTVNSIRLNDFRKITFSGDNITIHKTDNSQSNIALNNFRKIVFGDYQNPSGIENVVINDDIIAYYNGNNEIIVRSESATINSITIFDLNGRHLQSVQHTNVNVSNLSAGIYFLQINTNKNQITKKIIINK